MARPQVKAVAKPISAARVAAFEILERVANTDAHSDDLLHSSRLSELSQADRNLATTLVMGVLRWQIALDATIRPLLQRPDALASPVANALRLGAFQLLHLDRIPAHAALSESVELVRAAAHGHAAGMVNAILRGITRAGERKVPLFETTAAVSERLSHPAWMVERWVKHYGRAAAMAICEYDQTEPAAGGLFEDKALAMDDGSRLVAELAGACHPGARRIWDCCAAPGGKTRVLAMRHPDAKVLATDRSARRLKAMAERLRVANVRLLEADAAALPEGEGEFDLILCDVPCSGTGTLARNPELKVRLGASEPSRQAVVQKRILTAALQRLAPGGRLLYSTCSLEAEENEGVVAGVFGGSPDASNPVFQVPDASDIREVSLEETVARLVESGRVKQAVGLRGGRLRTLPGVEWQGDGFFAVLFERMG